MITNNKMRAIFGCLAALSLLCVTACGGDISVTEDEYVLEPPPSDARSAGVLSGFGYATGGENYKAVQSLGSPTAEDIQTSTNGRYQVK
jgi:hypothetical protein